MNRRVFYLKLQTRKSDTEAGWNSRYIQWNIGNDIHEIPLSAFVPNMIMDYRVC